MEHKDLWGFVVTRFAGSVSSPSDSSYVLDSSSKLDLLQQENDNKT